MEFQIILSRAVKSESNVRGGRTAFWKMPTLKFAYIDRTDRTLSGLRISKS
jgi:hypothetical protein